MPGFVDAAVVNGTAYGYAVSAFGAGGESAVSSSVVVTPVAPEPEPEPEPGVVPSDGLVVSLDASALLSSLGDGDEVSSWVSGAGGVVASASGSWRPVLVADGDWWGAVGSF